MSNPVILVVDGTRTETVGTGQETLKSYTLGAGSLAVGDIVEISARGSFNAQGDYLSPPTLYVKWGASPISAVNLGYNATPDQEIPWQLDCKVSLSDDQVQFAVGIMTVWIPSIFGSVAYALPIAPLATGTFAEDQSDDIVVSFLGESYVEGNEVFVDAVTITQYRQ